jgi:phage antirepressor YoqD-like protein
MAWFKLKTSELQSELDITKPKAIVYDKFMDGSNGQPIGDVAKVIGRKPHELHRLLREAKIMRDNYTPFSEYSHYFIVKEKPLPNGTNTFVSYVLPEGFNYIQKRFGN